MSGAQPAVFLDRDGVINENRADYVKGWSEVVFLPGAVEALRRLSEARYRLVIVTNQSAVGRGIITMCTAQGINRRLVETVQERGGRIDRVYMCPHPPAAGCECRKPQPKMLLDASAEMGLDLTRSYMVGDTRSDLEAARAAGAQGILVLTGRGRETAQGLGRDERSIWPVVADLQEAAEYILSDKGQPSISPTRRS